MENKLSKVNAFLSNKNELSTNKVNEIVLSGPETVRNILVNEMIKLQKLDSFSEQLLKYLMDPKAVSHLSYKDKQSVLNTVANIQSDSRDFLFRVAELSSKHEFFRQIIKTSQEPNTKIVNSSNGESYFSSLDDNEIKQLSEIIRDIAEDETM